MPSKPVPKTEKADPIDLMIGKRIRFRRNLLGITQEALARELGCSFQQIQKYESGQNKISASRLYHIAESLKTSIAGFFEDETLKPKARAGLSDQSQEEFLQDNLLGKSETTNLLRTYYEIKDKKKRKTALDMMKGLQS